MQFFASSLTFIKVFCFAVIVFQVGIGAMTQAITVTDLGRLESHLLCQGQRKNVTCKDTTLVMVIVSAHYGRTEEGSVLCPYRPTVDSGNDKDDSSDTALDCGDHDVTKIVWDRCDKKYRCSLKVDKKLIPSNPCPGTYKYLSVIFQCESRTPNNTRVPRISASPRSTLATPKVTAPSASSTSAKRRKRRTRTKTRAMTTATRTPQTTVRTSVVPDYTTTPKRPTTPEKTSPKSKQTTTEPTDSTTKPDKTSTKSKQTTTEPTDGTTLSTTRPTGEISTLTTTLTTEPTKHDPSTGIPVFVKTNATINDTVEPTNIWRRTTKTITTTIEPKTQVVGAPRTNPQSTTPVSMETTSAQTPALMPQDSRESSWENSTTYLTIFLISVFGAALLMAAGAFLVIRYQRKKNPHSQNIIHRPKRYIDLPPKPTKAQPPNRNGQAPGRKPRMDGAGREDGGVAARQGMSHTVDNNNKVVKQPPRNSRSFSHPEIENGAVRKDDEPHLHVNPLFTNDGKPPHPSGATTTDGNTNVPHDNHPRFPGNAVSIPRTDSYANAECRVGGPKSRSTGNVAHGYVPTSHAGSQYQRHPSVGGTLNAPAPGGKDGLYRFQSTGSVPLQRSTPPHGGKSPPRQDPAMWNKRPGHGGESSSRAVATMPSSLSGSTTTPTPSVHMPTPGPTPQGYGHSGPGTTTMANQVPAKYITSGLGNQSYSENAHGHAIPSIQVNDSGAPYQTSLAKGVENVITVGNTPNISNNPEHDARASPIRRKTPYGSPAAPRAEMASSNSEANAYGRAGKAQEPPKPEASPGQQGTRITGLTGSSELVSPLDAMPVGSGTNTNRLKILDRHNSLSYGQGGYSFHPPPPSSHDTVCDSSDDDLYSIVAKGKHYSCAVTDPNLSAPTQNASAAALPRHDEIKYIAVRVPRKV